MDLVFLQGRSLVDRAWPCHGGTGYLREAPGPGVWFGLVLATGAWCFVSCILSEQLSTYSFCMFLTRSCPLCSQTNQPPPQLCLSVPPEQAEQAGRSRSISITSATLTVPRPFPYPVPPKAASRTVDSPPSGRIRRLMTMSWTETAICSSSSRGPFCSAQGKGETTERDGTGSAALTRLLPRALFSCAFSFLALPQVNFPGVCVSASSPPTQQPRGTTATTAGPPELTIPALRGAGPSWFDPPR